MDIEVLSGACDGQLHVMVADVTKSFDTVGRAILDCALGCPGLPPWFRNFRLWFKLAAGLGEPWCRDGSIPQGCPLSMVFVVALHVPWCGRLEAMPAVGPQLFADNLFKCNVVCPRALLGASQGSRPRCVSWKVHPPQYLQGCQKKCDTAGCVGRWEALDC